MSDFYKAFERNQNDIAHYGVKGMKWGVINEEEPTGERPGPVPQGNPEMTRADYNQQLKAEREQQRYNLKSQAQQREYEQLSAEAVKAADEEQVKEHRKEVAKKVVKGVAAAAVVAGVVALAMKKRNGNSGDQPDIPVPHLNIPDQPTGGPTSSSTSTGTAQTIADRLGSATQTLGIGSGQKTQEAPKVNIPKVDIPTAEPTEKKSFGEKLRNTVNTAAGKVGSTIGKAAGKVGDVKEKTSETVQKVKKKFKHSDESPFMAAFEREANSDISHYGVRGMKWGVINKQDLKGGKAGAIQRGMEKSSDVKSQENWTLKDKVERMKLESDYRKLTEEEESYATIQAEKIRKAKAENLVTAVGAAAAAVGLANGIFSMCKNIGESKTYDKVKDKVGSWKQEHEAKKKSAYVGK